MRPAPRVVESKPTFHPGARMPMHDAATRRFPTRAAIAHLLVLLTVSLSSVAGVAHAQTAPAATPPTDAEIRRMLARRVNDQRAATGIVVGIVAPSGRRVVSYGTIGSDDLRPVDGETVYGVGSISKVLAALLLSDMARRGEVALDDPVERFLPADTEVRDRAGAAITLADLATHTSGLPLRPDNLVSQDPDNKYAGYTTARLFEFVGRFRPEKRDYHYSNVGYGLLGEALSRRAARPYGGLVAERIAQPLHMRDTRISPTPSMKRRQAVGYDNELKPAAGWDLGALSPAGGYYSTADDLLNLLEGLLDRRKTALRPAMDAMLATRRPGGMPPSDEIALAWNIHKSGQKEIAWKNGSVGGYRTFLGYDPSTGVGVVALANAQTATGVDDIGLHLLDPAIPVNLALPKHFSEVQVDSATLDRYVGTYWFSETDIVTVRKEDGQLTMQQPGQDKIPLFAYGKRDFFLKIADVQMTFETRDDGPATALIWHQNGQRDRGERVAAEETP